MSTGMFMRTIRAGLLGACAALVVGLLAGAPASATGDAGTRHAGSCQHQLDAAIRGFDAAFQRRDFDAYMAYYTDDAIQVDSAGTVYGNKTEIAAFIKAVMANEYTFTARVLDSNVQGCRSASVAEDAVFAIPEHSFTLHLIDGVHWVRQHGRWRVSMVQNTVVPPAS